MVLKDSQAILYISSMCRSDKKVINCAGCGGFADDNVGAVSTTGDGESIMRFCLAHEIITLMKQGNFQSSIMFSCKLF